MPRNTWYCQVSTCYSFIYHEWIFTNHVDYATLTENFLKRNFDWKRKAIARVALAASVDTRQQFERHQVDGIGPQRSDAQTRVAAAFCFRYLPSQAYFQLQL